MKKLFTILCAVGLIAAALSTAEPQNKVIVCAFFATAALIFLFLTPKTA